MDKINDARRRLKKKDFRPKPTDIDVNHMDYTKLERADILLPNGYREIWIREILK